MISSDETWENGKFPQPTKEEKKDNIIIGHGEPNKRITSSEGAAALTHTADSNK